MLEKLKEYKELIAILAFFLGGFFWLQSNFPSKSDIEPKLASIRCKLDYYMQLTQLQLRSQEQEKQVTLLAAQLGQIPRDDSNGAGLLLSPAMKVGIEQLKLDFTAKRNELGQTTAAIAKIRDDLARDICERG